MFTVSTYIDDPGRSWRKQSESNEFECECVSFLFVWLSVGSRESNTKKKCRTCVCVCVERQEVIWRNRSFLLLLPAISTIIYRSKVFLTCTCTTICCCCFHPLLSVRTHYIVEWSSIQAQQAQVFYWSSLSLWDHRQRQSSRQRTDLVIVRPDNNWDRLTIRKRITSVSKLVGSFKWSKQIPLVFVDLI